MVQVAGDSGVDTARNSDLFRGNSGIPLSLNNTLSLNNPPVVNNTPKLPTNILAFRTITTLLARIQQEKPPTFSNNYIIEEEEDILQLSNALPIWQIPIIIFLQSQRKLTWTNYRSLLAPIMTITN
jgi:hypothetical protein